MYPEDAYLQLSGIQHFVFCKRQWALIHIEQQWAENLRTVDGSIMHRHVHDAGFHETRNDTILARAMAVSSSEFGISGECDMVEFRRSSDGITLSGVEGTFSVTPIEYKRGAPKTNECDTMQLMAQALCLEEMLCSEIPYGYLYYGEIRHRVKVELDDALRRRTKSVIAEMHQLYARQHTPKVKRTKACNACSLKHICLPALCDRPSASDYILHMLQAEEAE